MLCGLNFVKFECYFSFLTANQRMPEMAKHTAQMAKMIDLSAALLTTSPILKLATNCGSTTERLKIPM